MSHEQGRYALVVPHYNHSEEFAAFLPALDALGLDCVVVDDGSESRHVAALRAVVDGSDRRHLVCREENGGKGAAVMTGARKAREIGATHIIQIDADGQHRSEDVERFIAASRNAPDTIVCGRPTFDDSAPKARLYGRKVTDFWVAIETLSLKIKDGLCGFRVYPLDVFELLLDRYRMGKRMDFDTEILVKAVWSDVPLLFIDTPVRYLEEGASHFNYLRDNVLLIKLHTRLMLGMVARLPMLLYRRLTPGRAA